MVRRLRPWAIAALVLAALCPAATEAARKKVATRVVSGRGVVAPGEDGRFSRRCPEAFPHPVGTRLSGGDGNLALGAAFAFGDRRRSWNDGVFNFGSARQPFTAGAVCLRAPGRFSYAAVPAELQQPVGGFVVSCPRKAQRAINATVAPEAAADVGDVVTTESRPANARDWLIGVRSRSLGTTPQRFSLGAVCVSAKVRVIHRHSHPIFVPPGVSDGAVGRCPRSARYPVAATFYPADASGTGRFTLSEAIEEHRRSLSVVVTNRSQHTERVVVGVLCVG